MNIYGASQYTQKIPAGSQLSFWLKILETIKLEGKI